MIRVKAPRDVGAGLLFIAIGAAGLYFGQDLTYGSSARMGPGFFPRILSWLIVGLGIVVGARGLAAQGPRIERVPWRPITMVVVSILVFGFAIEHLGLFVSAILLTFLAGAARAGSNYRELALLGLLLAALSVGVFAYGLRQPMPAWPPFIMDRLK